MAAKTVWICGWLDPRTFGQCTDSVTVIENYLLINREDTKAITGYTTMYPNVSAVMAMVQFTLRLLLLDSSGTCWQKFFLVSHMHMVTGSNSL